MYHAINEGSENEHQEVKAMSHTVFKNAQAPGHEDSPHQAIINQQQMMRALRRKGFAPTNWTLEHIPSTFSFPTSTTIPPLRQVDDAYLM